MSEVPGGPGWWEASDLKWYPPELHPNYEAPPAPLGPPTPPDQQPQQPAPSQPPGESPGPGWWQASDHKWYPPQKRPDRAAPPPSQAAGLSNLVAPGAISADAISSIAYGPEQILIELLPAAGMAAFVLLLPITAVILLILVIVAASYRQVITVYARAGGAYAAARDNFGPRVAQVARAALLIDYVTTVAVQCAAGTVAVASAMPALGPYRLELAVGAVLVMCLANLLGLRRAGPIFAIATYSFVAMITLTIMTGLVRAVVWGLPMYDPSHMVGAVPLHQGNGLVMGATILVLLRAFATGGSSLTGIETIPETAEVFCEPQGLNARRVLTAASCILGVFLVGVAWLAYATHATPLFEDYPSMLSQIARAVFGNGLVGTGLYLLVQAATAAILFVGASTSFHGFPASAGFVAKDDRYKVAIGSIVLALLSAALLLVTGGLLTGLVLLYAISAFVVFSMAGYSMTKHHLARRERGWRRHLAISLTAGVLSSIVAMIFAVTKFTEGAWLIVFAFLVLVPALILRQRSPAEGR
jgi:amino acid transporter